MATALSALRVEPFRTSGVRTNGRPGLSQMDLFAGLPERDMALLDSRLPLVRWPRGAAMPDPLGRPDHLYVVREGRLALYESTAPGHEIMISLLDSGAIYSTLGTAPGRERRRARGVGRLAALGPRDRGADRPLPAPRPQPGRDALGPGGDAARDRGPRERDARRGPPPRPACTSSPTGSASRPGPASSCAWSSPTPSGRRWWRLAEAVTTAFSKLPRQRLGQMEGRTITIPWEVVRAREEALSLAAHPGLLGSSPWSPRRSRRRGSAGGRARPRRRRPRRPCWAAQPRGGRSCSPRSGTATPRGGCWSSGPSTATSRQAGAVVRALLRRAGAPRRPALVIHDLNPDGAAARTRQNAHGVNLNRRIPPTAWRARGRPFSAHYGRRRPLFEPEFARLAARLIRRLRPDMTIWCHQALALVEQTRGRPTAA